MPYKSLAHVRSLPCGRHVFFICRGQHSCVQALEVVTVRHISCVQWIFLLFTELKSIARTCPKLIKDREP